MARVMDRCDIAIIGGGAAGLAAGIFAAEETRVAGVAGSGRPTVLILEGAKKIGAKILVSGGGRCNVSHETVRPDDFNGARSVVRNTLAAFPVPETVRWFASMGVLLKREETGKLFPTTDDAHTVLGGLIGRCRELGVGIRTGHRILEVRVDRKSSDPASDSWFALRHEGGELFARRVILATGGRSLPRSGSDGQGFEIARRFGHQVTDTHPALVPLVLDAGMFHWELAGVSHPVDLRITANGLVIDRRVGDLLWTHFGVSGPVVLDASRHWTVARAAGHEMGLRCSFLPGLDARAVEQLILSRAEGAPRRTIGRILAERLPERVAQRLLEAQGFDRRASIGQLPRESRRRLAAMLTDFPLPVVRDRGWNFAEVTAGGVLLSEIDYQTMESRIVPGLHLVGEILDCDGRIGGFNFQWAWATGRIAGTAAARSAMKGG